MALVMSQSDRLCPFMVITEHCGKSTYNCLIFVFSYSMYKCMYIKYNCILSVTLSFSMRILWWTTIHKHHLLGFCEYVLNLRHYTYTHSH